MASAKAITVTRIHMIITITIIIDDDVIVYHDRAHDVDVW